MRKRRAPLGRSYSELGAKRGLGLYPKVDALFWPNEATDFQRLFSILPPGLMRECTLMRAAMVPRCGVCLYVPDHDCKDKFITVHDLVIKVQARIRQITGGQTTYHASGEYVPQSGTAMVEGTCVLETFLPAKLSDSSRDELTALFLWFGISANQEVVLVTVHNLAYWLPTGLLLDAEREATARVTEGTLLAD